MTAMYFSITFILTLITIIVLESFGFSVVDEDLFYYKYNYIITCTFSLISVILVALQYRKKIPSMKNILETKDITILKTGISLLIGGAFIVITSNLTNPYVNSYAKYESGIIIFPKLTLLIGTVIATILWEIFFRGMIFGLIKGKINAIVVILLSATLGAIVNFINVGGNSFTYEMLLGVIVSIIYYYSGEIWYCITVRLIINLVPMFNITASKYIYTNTAITISFCVLAFSLLIYYRDFKQKNFV